MLSESLLAHPWLFICTIMLCYQVTRAIYRITYHPLAQFPGPKLAALTRWSVLISRPSPYKGVADGFCIRYEIYYELMQGGRFAQQIEILHQQYGPVIRINPFELHINDPEYYNQIYSFDCSLEKRDFHIQNVQHTGPYPRHRPLRRALDPYLSRTTVQRLEPLITHNIEALCRHFAAARSHKQPITLSHLYRCMTGDIITSYTLGKSYDLLAVGNEVNSESFLRAFQFTFRLL
ncbi:MAG: hypothetical protein L6R36_000185 [Xanthoria steineri]|nr:MAG: hypothetical protein L6R36_000185 [Xanthoria steineri]